MKLLAGARLLHHSFIVRPGEFEFRGPEGFSAVPVCVYRCGRDREGASTG